jgi:hypothetical protein
MMCTHAITLNVTTTQATYRPAPRGKPGQFLVPRHPDSSSTSDVPATKEKPSVEVSSDSDTDAPTAKDAPKKDSSGGGSSSSSSKLKPHVEFRSVREVSGTGSLFKLELKLLHWLAIDGVIIISMCTISSCTRASLVVLSVKW